MSNIEKQRQQAINEARYIEMREKKESQVLEYDEKTMRKLDRESTFSRGRISLKFGFTWKYSILPAIIINIPFLMLINIINPIIMYLVIIIINSYFIKRRISEIYKQRKLQDKTMEIMVSSIKETIYFFLILYFVFIVQSIGLMFIYFSIYK